LRALRWAHEPLDKPLIDLIRIFGGKRFSLIEVLERSGEIYMLDGGITKQKQVNGLNVDELFATVDAIKVEPEIARFNFRASNKWVSGGNNQTKINEYSGACQEFSRDEPFVIQKDVPPILLGNDRGANPVEYVLAALAGCLTTSLVYHAAARGIKIEEVESAYEGDIDLRGFLGMNGSVRNGYENIRISLKVKGDASEKELQELVEIAQKHSPVFDIVTNKVPVLIELAE
jgi:uncharacterized OsmC-like protein